MDDYLKKLFIDEAKPALKRHSGSGGGGDTDLLNSIIEGTITEFSTNAESIGTYLCRGWEKLTTVYFPFVKTIGREAFRECPALTTVKFPLATRTGIGLCRSSKVLKTAEFPSATIIDASVFEECPALTTVKFPLATKIDTYAFYNCIALETIDLPSATYISAEVFRGCSLLTTVVLRNEQIVTLNNINAFNNTPIAKGTGYIYVPSALVDTYKSATNWSTYATQFRALEDYTVDGTITGELDESKI